MTQVLHLVRHDIVTHRRLLFAWLIVVLLHPVVSLLPWPALSAVGFPAALVMIAGRLGLGAVAIATVIQSDSPLDDRTFWRTRPIGARVMATAKLVIGALFVGVPLLVVLTVAMAVGVPASHLPSTIAQVVVTDAAAVGLVLFLSSTTRGVASMLVALLGTLFGSWVLLVAIAETLRAPWVRQFYLTGPPSPQLAGPTMLVAVVLATWTMSILIFLGQQYRLRLLLLGAVGVLALAIIWFVPAARLHQPPLRFDRHPMVSVDASRVRAERLESGRVALIAEGHLAGLQPGDRSRQYLLDGTIDSDDSAVAARQPTDLGFLAGGPERQPVLLGVLGEQDFSRLAGRPVRFTGRIDIEVARTEVVGMLPVAAGARLDLGDMLLRIRELRPSVQQPAFVPVAAVDVTWSAPWTQGPRLLVTQWWLRHPAGRQYVARFSQMPFTELTLLPSLARPFGYERSVVYLRQGAEIAVDAEASIEIEESRRPVHTQQPLQTNFVVPATMTPYRTIPIAR